MNIVDILIFLLVIFTVLRGIEVGFVRQAASFVGLIGGIYIGSMLGGWLSDSPTVHSMIVLLTIVGFVVISELAGIRIKLLLHNTKLNLADKSFGGAMGVVTCLVLVWLVSTLISAVPAPGLQQNIRDSRVIAWLDDTLPPATDVIAQLERSIAETRLPELLQSNEPQLSPGDTSLPELAALQPAIDAARASIVELEGRSCQGISVGSGFVVSGDLVVTNAHVVGGMRTPYVKDANGRHPAEVVAFDPDLDIAVLRVNNLAGGALPIEQSPVAVGTAGVVLGYPRGGPFQASPARVMESFTALGRDIYNEQPTERDVYAVRGAIQPGNSGGPLISDTSEVIGVIFARSTSYEGIGYAVTMEAVNDVIANAQQNPSPGESSRCVPN